MRLGVEVGCYKLHYDDQADFNHKMAAISEVTKQVVSIMTAICAEMTRPTNYGIFAKMVVSINKIKQADCEKIASCEELMYRANYCRCRAMTRLALTAR